MPVIASSSVYKRRRLDTSRDIREALNLDISDIEYTSSDSDSDDDEGHADDQEDVITEDNSISWKTTVQHQVVH